MKELDFNLFMPILHDLQFLWLGENRLSHLNGFKNALLPKLELLDITANDFNCSYLYHFMKNVDWKHLRLHLAPYSSKTGESNVRGVRCNEILFEPEPSVDRGEVTNNYSEEIKNLTNILQEISTKLNPKSNDDIFVKIVLVLILMAFTVFTGLFLVFNRHQFKRDYSKNEHTLSISYSKGQDESLLL